ncbi:MAG: DUF1540 domain-containing protein [Oscillospiraceae bacterium]|jgi:hypothetical protein|nr:DUF1540 domain-containing protein [Oscillospiraceae bacterium]
MTELQCSVKDCMNNSQSCCCRPDIMVSGKCACGCEQTSCADFRKKGSASAQNSCGCSQPDPQMHVRCEAEKCIYNEQGDCTATDIQVSSTSPQTSGKSETECATFKMK